ncbi:hypothetical protein ES703_20290 [subsurface metagenome]
MCPFDVGKRFVTTCIDRQGTHPYTRGHHLTYCAFAQIHKILHDLFLLWAKYAVTHRHLDHGFDLLVRGKGAFSGAASEDQSGEGGESPG